MDSLTQFVLGAAVGDVVAGKKAGKKAMLWGAVGGTIPDLDVLLNLFYDEPRSLLLHRGFSHSVFFAFLAAPLLGYFFSKVDRSLSRRDWMLLFFWAIFTHPLLDVFTGYGTGLFVPLWDYRIQFDTIFIIDPVYTLPLFVAFVWLLLKAKPLSRRRPISAVALVVSNCYLLITVFVKLWVLGKVNEELTRQHVAAEKKLVAPAAFTTFLWSVVVKEGDHFLAGYYSLFGDETIEFRRIPAQHRLLEELDKYPETAMLVKFAKGFFVLERNGDNFIFNDLRFGTAQGWDVPDAGYIFSFELKPHGDRLEVGRNEPERAIGWEDLARLFDRTFGN